MLPEVGGWRCVCVRIFHTGHLHDYIRDILLYDRHVQICKLSHIRPLNIPGYPVIRFMFDAGTNFRTDVNFMYMLW